MGERFREIFLSIELINIIENGFYIFFLNFYVFNKFLI